MIPKYISYLYDDEEAWKAALMDVEYRYDMPMWAFNQIYQKYRTIADKPEQSISVFQASAPMPNVPMMSPATPPPPPAPPESKQPGLLEQDDIDALLASLSI